MLWPSPEFVTWFLGVLISLAFLFAHPSGSSDSAERGGRVALVGAVLLVLTSYQTGSLVWRGGGLRRGRRASKDVCLQNGETSWLGRTRMGRGMVLEFRSTAEEPPLPGIELLYGVRPVDDGGAGGLEDFCLPGRAIPPWWLRNRHARVRPRVFPDLVPAALYDYGVAAGQPLRSPVSICVRVVQTFSLRALIRARQSGDSARVGGPSR